MSNVQARSTKLRKLVRVLTFKLKRSILFCFFLYFFFPLFYTTPCISPFNLTNASSSFFNVPFYFIFTIVTRSVIFYKSHSDSGSCGHTGEQSKTKIGRDVEDMFAVPLCEQLALKMRTEPAGLRNAVTPA